MFGYVKPYPPELKIKEYDFYRSVYCGLCRVLGRHIALCAKFTLSYDIVFLALLSMSLNNERIEIKHRHCALHPMKKRPMMEINQSLIASAETGALLFYYKIADDYHDSRSFRKLLPLMILPVAKYIKRKMKQSEKLDAEIKSGLQYLEKLENDKTTSIDSPADAFGNIMAAVFAFTCREGKSRRIGEVIGKYTGRWIYIIDALDDFKNDRKHGLYNPFLYNTDMTDKNIENALTGELRNIEKAINLIDFNESEIQNIINNIIYLEMPRRAKEIIYKNSGNFKLSNDNKERNL